MRNEELRLLAAGVPEAEEGTGGAKQARLRQQVRGVAGRLRPYRDVRASFEPWRRVALQEWAAREDRLTVH